MYHTGLHQRLGPCGLDRVGESAQAVTAHDQRVFEASVAYLGQYRQPEVWLLRRRRRAIPPARVYGRPRPLQPLILIGAPRPGAGLTRLRPGCCAFVVICRPAAGLGAVLSRQGGCDLIGALLLPCDASMYSKSCFRGGWFGCLCRVLRGVAGVFWLVPFVGGGFSRSR